MKTVICPICQNSLYSECFLIGETFSCPHCENELIVEDETDVPKIRAAFNLFEGFGWAHGIWRNGRLILTPAKLKIFGEIFVKILEMEKWSKETPDELSKRKEKLEIARNLLKENAIDDSFFMLARSLLDFFDQGNSEKKS
ncbi:MAG: hypothetical protein HQM08_16665 [Candidatus Riflebacteria bacterium]|nr:hypothetical protein [Candidatus Riflebacteria bacterium]